MTSSTTEATARSVKLSRARLVIDEWEAEEPIPPDVAAAADAKLAETLDRLVPKADIREGMKVVYTPEALIALDKGEHAMRRCHARLNLLGIVPVVPALALAQAWPGRKQARMANAIKDADHVDLTTQDAQMIGRMFSGAPTVDTADASYIVAAAPVGVIVTHDAFEFRRIVNRDPELAIEVHEFLIG